MDLRIECRECKKEINIGLNVKREDVQIKGQSITLTYFDCPNCSKRYFGQADTAQTKGELQQYKKNLKVFTRLKRNGKEIPKNLSAQLSSSQKHLSLIRKYLIAQLSGMTVKMANGNEYRLEFENVQG